MNPQANRQQGLDPSRGDSSRESTSTRAVATNNVDVATRKEIEADASSSDASEEEPNFDHLPQLKRPRKKAYKSTLCKRDREKKRRDHFNEGLQQLAGEFSIVPLWLTSFTFKDTFAHFAFFPIQNLSFRSIHPSLRAEKITLYTMESRLLSQIEVISCTRQSMS
jgi:hypothetical protein